MIFVGALGVVTGLALAYYFGVFILLPATLLAITGTILFEVVARHSLVPAWSDALYIAVGLQLGFIARVLLKTYLTSTAVAPPSDHRKVVAMSLPIETTSRLETGAELPESQPAPSAGRCETQPQRNRDRMPS